MEDRRGKIKTETAAEAGGPDLQDRGGKGEEESGESHHVHVPQPEPVL